MKDDLTLNDWTHNQIEKKISKNVEEVLELDRAIRLKFDMTA